jgi:hypothetical protein
MLDDDSKPARRFCFLPFHRGRLAVRTFRMFRDFGVGKGVCIILAMCMLTMGRTPKVRIPWRPQR